MKRLYSFFVLTILSIFLLLISCSSEKRCNSREAHPGENELLKVIRTSWSQNTIRPSTFRAAKISLWQNKTQLRGANIWQSRPYNGIMAYDVGEGPVGPAYTQEDFDNLAALGANYVNISCPGLYAESPPHRIHIDVQNNLDRLLVMIEKADMFAVISFRTGPGRSEFTFNRDEVGDWFKAEDLDESVWTDRKKQDAWVAMWRYTAGRYKDNPIIAGYDIMCEPNGNVLLEHRLENCYDPAVFYGKYKNSSMDWNTFFPSVATAIRRVDGNTPILIQPMSYGSIYWLDYLKKIEMPGIVYAVHAYEPHEQYTHQDPKKPMNGYPGKCDLDYDGRNDDFNRQWLEKYLSAASRFSSDNNSPPMAVNEFGVMRWVPGASAFLKDLLDILERLHLNHAIWMWHPSKWPEDTDEFNFNLGPDPKTHANQRR